MSDNLEIHNLILDSEFYRLSCPLSRQEYTELEKSILEEGCIEPLEVWNNIVVDGHKRYRICRKYNISFYIIYKAFESRTAAIAWICSNQLKKHNLTEEFRKYLIGLQYEAEKIIDNGTGTDDPIIKDPEIQRSPTGYVTAMRIAEENHVSWNTIYKYSVYARTIEEIGKKAPDIVPFILSGRYKISQKNLIDLSKMSPEQIDKIVVRLEKDGEKYVQYKKARKEISSFSDKKPINSSASTASVKDMPSFDPDAEIISLALTIPSWSGSIDRVVNKTDFTIVTSAAKNKLIISLQQLNKKLSDLLRTLKEGLSDE
ncbi:MAG: hypothetical protein IKH13_09270 [Clostridia bacterium]|nr:hypothetical protein [Clostridia bacterium]